MYKYTATYTDYDGVERTEDFLFNLSEAEIVEMEYGVTGGMKRMLEQIVAAKESALSLQQDTFQATELKYKQGKISKNAYLDAQDALESAKTDVITAKHNLFTAYRTYHWAVDFGVLN